MTLRIRDPRPTPDAAACCAALAAYPFRIFLDSAAYGSAVVSSRYDSLTFDRATLPEALSVTTIAEDDDAIMAVVHRTHPIIGVQFHPESAATEHGHALLVIFLAMHSRRMDLAS